MNALKKVANAREAEILVVKMEHRFSHQDRRALRHSHGRTGEATQQEAARWVINLINGGLEGLRYQLEKDEETK